MYNILITGGNGFIGSNFIKKALKEKYIKKIINIDKDSNQSICDNFLNIKSKKYVKIKDNLSSEIKINGLLKKYKINLILHMAAETHVDRSITNPKQFINSNINPTVNLLEACRKYQCEYKKNIRFIYFSTDEVFGSNHDKKPFTLDSQFNPSSPYSSSKAASGAIVNSWRHTFKIKASIIYCCNNYGPYQNSEKLIPATLFRSINSIPILVYGKGDQIRTWIHVNDTVTSVLKIITTSDFDNLDFMISSNIKCSNIEIINKICKILEKKNKMIKYSKLIKHTKDRPGHDKAYILSEDLKLKKLGIKNYTTINNGLESTVQWYLDNQNYINKKNKNNLIKLLSKVGFK